MERSLLLLLGIGMVVGAANPATWWGFLGAAYGSAALVARAWMRGDVTMREALVVAVFLRLAAFPLPPVLSDDGYRYVWDGLLQVSGVNPYSFIPEDMALRAWHGSPLFERLNSAGYYSVYPPASQLVFLFGAWLGGGGLAAWYVIKGVFLAMELVGIGLLSRLVAPRHLILYAWHPLVVIELAGQAHSEAGMVAGLIVGYWAYRRGYHVVAVIAVTLAGWFKLVPLVLLPFLLRRVGWRYALMAAGVSAILWLPYFSLQAVDHVRSSLDLYVRLFEFNAGPYYLLKRILLALTGEDWSKSLGPALQLVFVAGLGLLFWRDLMKPLALAWVWLLALTLFLVTATTVHPWYLTGVLALLPLASRDGATPSRLHAAAWLALSVGALGTYLYYGGGVRVYWVSVIASWSTFFTALTWAGGSQALPLLLRRRAHGKWAWIAPHVGTPDRLLDLGAGEGYVGEIAAAETGAEVLLLDVVDLNESDLTLRIYDGIHIPYPDRYFDTTLSLFVLHHTADPEAVIREARRVTRGRVIVVESVVETACDRLWLPFVDRVVNRIRSGGRMRAQEEHLRFQPVVAWRTLFENNGFEVELELRRGHWWHKQTLFVLNPLLQ